MAAAAPATTATSRMARVGSVHSSLGTHAPINTPTPRLDVRNDRLEQDQEPDTSDPNVYLVQPFKHASLPKDLIYGKKKPPNPAEGLLNSTIDLIDHFTSCYESLKHQLKDDQGQNRDRAETSRARSAVGTSHMNISRNALSRPAKQARLKPLILTRNQQGRDVDGGPHIGTCVGISPVPITKVNDLAHIYDEKLRQLRRLKPEFFDTQGNLLSKSSHQLKSHNHTSARSSKKSATSSFRTPHNTLRTGDNVPFDDRRTFLTEFTNEEEDDDEKKEQQKTSVAPFVTQQMNPANEFMKKNYVIQVLEIKTVTTTMGQSRTRPASAKSGSFVRKGSTTAKSG